MASRLLTFAGLVQTLFPNRIVAIAERLAFRDPGEAELRSWIRPAARVEGVLWVLLARRSGPSPLRWLLGLLGVPFVLAPKSTVEMGLKLTYTRSETIEVAPWVVPATRVIGLVYILVGIRSIRSRVAHSTPVACIASTNVVTGTMSASWS